MPRRCTHSACDDFRLTREARRREFVPRPLTRRQVIAGGLGATLSIYAAKAMPFARMLEAAEAQAQAAPNAPVLVSVFLPGGTDLLDTLIPLGAYGRYADLRGDTRVAEPGEPIADGLGIHPALTQGANGGIRGLFEAGKLGFLPGIDYANPDLSHFASRHFWETGMITQREVPGWLGRWLDRHGSPDNPLQGLSVDWSMSPVMRSGGAPVAALASPGDAQLYVGGLWDEPYERAMAAWAGLAGPRPAGEGREAVFRAARLAREVGIRLAPYEETDDHDPLAPSVPYPPDNEFAERLSRLAALLAQPLGIRLATVDANGDFDTHDNQPASLAGDLAAVSEALAAFQLDLETRGIADRVLTFVWSEFGRRPEANESDGTDHGAGGIAWVQGTRARPGIHSAYPPLDRFDRDDNLLVTVDFRSVYASLLEQWLGTDAGATIPDAGRVPRVGVVA